MIGEANNDDHDDDDLISIKCHRRKALDNTPLIAPVSKWDTLTLMERSSGSNSAWRRRVVLVQSMDDNEGIQLSCA